MEEIKMKTVTYEETITLYQKTDRIYGTLNSIREIYSLSNESICDLEIKQLISRIFDQKELFEMNGHVLWYPDLVFYDHDMIISVGYKINSVLATRFRLWVGKKLIPSIINNLRVKNQQLESQLAVIKVKISLTMKWYVFSFQNDIILQRLFLYTNGCGEQDIELIPKFKGKIIYVSKPLTFVETYLYFLSNYKRRIDRIKNKQEVNGVSRKLSSRDWYALKAFNNYNECIGNDQAGIVDFFEKQINICSDYLILQQTNK